MPLLRVAQSNLKPADYVSQTPTHHVKVATEPECSVKESSVQKCLPLNKQASQMILPRRQ